MKDCKAFLHNNILSGFIFIKKIYRCLSYRFPIKILFTCDIDNIFNCPKSTRFGHPFGIVIGAHTKVGENCFFRQNVTIGHRIKDRTEYGATIGDNVQFGAGAIVLGDVTIGNNCWIGAGSIVLKDVPDNTTVIGVWK